MPRRPAIWLLLVLPALAGCLAPQPPPDPEPEPEPPGSDSARGFLVDPAIDQSLVGLWYMVDPAAAGYATEGAEDAVDEVTLEMLPDGSITRMVVYSSGTYAITQGRYSTSADTLQVLYNGLPPVAGSYRFSNDTLIVAPINAGIGGEEFRMTQSRGQ